MPIRDLFLNDVTRDIPPVVYFHEQDPVRLADEVGEYIITGGWNKTHPNHRRVPDGIHEQYVRLLGTIAEELDRAGGPELPNVWISGFYGSGKSSFAKLLGLALDGIALPGGRSLAEALLARDTSERSAELHAAWATLRHKIDPLAVVFDIGGCARDGEHVHSVAVRQLQGRLGYSVKSSHVAFGELEIERDGRWADFERLAVETFARPWRVLKDEPQVQARFSNLMARLYPDVYRGDRDWHMRHGGMAINVLSPEEAIKSIRDMRARRAANATLFFVVDEVSQYVLASGDRVERLRAFASALGSGLRGKAWLLAIGQQKLEEDADESFLVKTKDRFPPKLRVHLAATNIRDVVHKRLLQKKPQAEAELRALFEAHRPALRLYAYGCDPSAADESASAYPLAEEFAEVYPLLPGYIDLLLKITSAMRTRSSRAQGDDQAIRGLLQLLGELFREQGVAEAEIGSLVTLDHIYEVQHTALDSDLQASMARILDKCAADASGTLTRVAKAVAMLELIQDTVPTDARLVAKCLYGRVGQGNNQGAVAEALERLRRDNLLGYSEKQGYKVQSSVGEEWERERKDKGVPRETVHEIVQGALKYLAAQPERPRYQGRSFPIAAVFSDGRDQDEVAIMDSRDDAVVLVDFRLLTRDERAETGWVKRSDETALRNRLVWVCGDTDQAEQSARNLALSKAMVRKYEPRRESLNPARKLLLQQEQIRVEELEVQAREQVAACFMAGRLYFRGRSIAPVEHGAAFGTVLSAMTTRVLPDLFPHFVATNISPAELTVLVKGDFRGISPKFLAGELGILDQDADGFIPSCGGVVPRRVQEHIENEGGLSGTSLLAWFGGPPYGYTANVVKACVAGLLHGGKIRIQPEVGDEITATRDAGVNDLFEKDRAFRRASFFKAEGDDIGFPARARICKFFEARLNHKVERDDNAIAEAVSRLFPDQARRLRDVLTRLGQIPGSKAPATLTELQEVFEQAVAKSRYTKQTVQLLKRRIDALNDGVQVLNTYDAELTEAAIQAVRRAAVVRDFHFAQLAAVEALDADLKAAGERLAEHLRAERPWRELGTLDPDLQAVLLAYLAERTRLLVWQEALTDQARGRVKARAGFATLTADDAHRVLRPIAQAPDDTTAEAVAPALAALKDPFLLRWTRKEAEANEILDEILSGKKLIVPVDLGLRGREVSTEAEVEALVGEVRERLMAQVQDGKRVRLI